MKELNEHLCIEKDREDNNFLKLFYISLIFLTLMTSYGSAQNIVSEIYQYY